MVTNKIGDAVALLAWSSYLHLYASVTEQYSLVQAKGSDHFGWESSRRPGGK